MSPEAIQGWLNLGVGGLLISALLLGFRRIWVWGWYASALEKERDEWKVMALGGLKAAAELAQAAKQHTTLTPEEADVALRIVREAGRKQ